MGRRVSVPLYAKVKAKQGLQERKINKASLTLSEARVLRVQSGVERAKQLIGRKAISEETAKEIARFYLRFRNRRNSKSETALKLWGGRKWGQILSKKYYG